LIWQQQQQQQDIDIDTLVTNLEKLEDKFILQKRRKFDPFKKLNFIKIDMFFLECYKKYCKDKGIGYYESYKSMAKTSDLD